MIRPRRLAGVTTLAVGICTALVFLASGAFAGGNAGYTTFDATALGCLDSPNGVDCNNYESKDKVYMSGGPSTGAGLEPGDYFFAVLVPGFQNGGFLDGADGNLSDTTASHDDKSDSLFTGAGGGDPVACRTFSTSNGLITSYSPGTGCTSGGYVAHNTGTSTAQTGSKLIIQLAPYDDTTNGGGVYILAICKVGATSPSDCKFDAFRIQNDNEVPPASDLDASKNAVPSFTRTFTWGITKSACAHGITPCTQTVNGTSQGTAVQFDYAVTVTKSAGTDSGWQTAGTITVNNPNALGDAYNVSITDTDNKGGSCNVDSSGSASENLGTVSAGASVQKSYVCTFTGNPGSGTNTVTAMWNPNLSDGTITPHDTDTGTANYTFGDPTTVSGDCISVTDTFNGTTTTLLPDPQCSTHTFNYSHTVYIPANGCMDYPNTATFTGAGVTTGLFGSASQTVRVCRVPPQTGALTMGFWQNKNGQGIISGQAKTGTCPSATWLRQYAPFQDLSATATCSGVATYVYNIIKAATCGGTTCNAMLKAQMLATALDVYFSDPALGGNKINAPSPIGSRIIDLQNVCKMIDGSGGTATCSGVYYDVSSAFGNASCLSVSGMLTYAASQYLGVSAWYGQDKPTQVKAKDGFDAINNSVALVC